MDILDKILRRNSAQLMNLPNVVGVGKGWKMTRGETTRDMSIVVLVRKKIPSQELHRSEKVPKTLGQANTDVLEVGEIRLLGRTDYQRPAPPGVSIGHYQISAGTFGAVVRDRNSEELLILSNNHVLANSTDGRDGRSKKGDLIFQPGPHDGGTKEHLIGYLDRFIPLSREYGASTCPQASSLEHWSNLLLQRIRPNYRVVLQRQNAQGNLVDAAVARPVSQNAITPEILEVGNVKGVKEAQIGAKLKKSGRSSGLNTSEVRVVSALMRVALSTQESVMFDDQIVTGPMASPGDSGSLVLDEDNYAIGLLFAGSDSASVVNRIQHVMEMLEIDPVVT
ncbi:MAG TPA: hypothetical protein GX711_02430 [Clostridia bacterium]|nr:hypothetical protein [Clostridia bacterium]